MQKHRRKHLLCVLVLAGLLASLFPAVPACAEDGDENYIADIPSEYAVNGGCETLPVYFDGLLTLKAYRSGDLIRIPVADVCTFLGSELSGYWYEPAKSLILSGTGIDICVYNDLDYLEVNNRYLYSEPGFSVIDGRVCLPEDVIERIFGIALELSEDGTALYADTLDYMVIGGWVGYYEDIYGEDDVSLLAHLISAEAGNSELAARIGVGNVVFNRMASEKYPESMYDVIYDTNYGVQFSPTVNGKLEEEPNDLSYVAACLCFEGYNTVQDALFFDDAWGSLSWLDDSRFVCRIGNHCFYH